MAATRSDDKPFGISQIKAYIPIILDLNKLNYDTWRELFETHCLTFGVADHLTAASAPATSTDKAWYARDGLVKMWIYGTITETILDTVLKPKSTSHELWLAIENLFRDNKEVRAIDLDHELRTTTMGDLDLASYCRKLKKTSDLLANISDPVPERTLVTYLLNGLSENFDNIINVIKHQTPFPTFAKAQSMLDMEEKRLAKHVKPQPTSTSTSSSPTVLYMTSDPSRETNQFQGHQGRGYRNRGRGGRPNRGKGRHHYNAWGQHKHHSPSPWSYGPPQWSSPYGTPPSPMAQFPAHSHNQPSPPPSILGRYAPQPRHDAHLAHGVQTYTPPASSPQYLPPDLANAFSTMTLQTPGDTNWYMDSGATDHITAQPGTLRSTFNLSVHPLVMVGNGSFARVSTLGHGTIGSTKRPLHLQRVLVCPSFVKNLVSVCRFTIDNQCSVEFDPYGFCVKDLETKTTFLRCDSTGPLY